MALFEAGVAGAAAATAGSLGFGLFGYNRANYMFDAGMRYERFTSGREFAIQQMEQYRKDITKLSELTAKKNGMYAIFASLCMALCVALYCAGRLGLHGPSPPVWIMGLWLTNNAAAFAYMAVVIWLSFHASFRAQAAATHLLTRKIRLPVPSLRQLDKARKFGSEFEQAAWGDIFRVPYISNNGAPKFDEAGSGPEVGGRASSVPASRRTNKESTWIREEFETDRAGTVAGLSTAPADVAPEHFQLYAKIQKDFYQYDVYARGALLYGYLSFVHALGYYGLGHINVELRAFWVAYACVFVIMSLHCILLNFDIVQNNKERNEYLPYCQWLGAPAVLLAAIGMSVDFRVEFNMVAIVITWVLIFLSYILQFVYSCRLVEMIIPDEFQAQERIGDAWWPETWKVPSRFQHVLYLVAPPCRLQPGQNDIVREIKEGHQDTFTMSAQNQKGGPSPEQMTAQIKYLDSLFQWAFMNDVFDRLSEYGKDKVRQLYTTYNTVREAYHTSSKSPGEAAKVMESCLSGLDEVMGREGIAQNIAATDLSSGEEADSPAGSGNESSPFTASPGSNPRRALKGSTPFKQTEYIQPWRMVTGLTITLTASWALLIVFMIVDCIIGTQGLVTAPHWSRPPMTRISFVPHEVGTPIGFPWPAGSQPWIPEQLAWHEEKREHMAETLFEAGGYANGNRRLFGMGAAPAAMPPMPMGHPGKGLHQAVQDVLRALPGERDLGAGAEPITWPGFFEPSLLACGPNTMEEPGSVVAALTPRGFGAAARVGEARSHGGSAVAAEAFRLAGIAHLPPLLSASWGATSEAGHEGLLLVTRNGHLVTCPGPRPAAGGAWPCAAPSGLPAMLPVPQGGRLAAAAVAWLRGLGGAGGDQRLHVALVHESEPSSAALFHLDGEEWMPLGEVGVPGMQDITEPAQALRTTLAFAGDGHLLMANDAGAVLQRRLRDGAVMMSSTPTNAQRVSTWRAACGLQHAKAVAHLHLREAAGARARLPELLFSKLEGQTDPDVLI